MGGKSGHDEGPPSGPDEGGPAPVGGSRAAEIEGKIEVELAKEQKTREEERWQSERKKKRFEEGRGEMLYLLRIPSFNNLLCNYFTKLNILRFNDLVNLNQANFMYRYVNNKLPFSFVNLFLW